MRAIYILGILNAMYLVSVAKDAGHDGYMALAMVWGAFLVMQAIVDVPRTGDDSPYPVSPAP